MRTIIIGDIHGCVEELVLLLRKLGLSTEGPTEGVRLISAGDLIDKGPSPAEVVKLARRVGMELVIGNHEEKFLRFVAHEERIQGGSTKPNPMHHLEEFRLLQAALDADDLAFLRSGRVALDVPGGQVVHAGVTPSTPGFPNGSWGSLSSKDRQHNQECLRVRQVGRQGKLLRGKDGTDKMLDLDHAEAGDPFWATRYDGRFGTLFFGHTAWDGNVLLRHRILSAVRSWVPESWWVRWAVPRINQTVGLDLGCVYGGFLVAAIVSETGAVTFESVPARRAYAPRREV